MIVNNKVEIDLGGESIGFYYGTYVDILFEEALGIPITEFNDADVKQVGTFLWACALAYREFFGDGSFIEKPIGFLYADLLLKKPTDEVADFMKKLMNSPEHNKVESEEANDSKKK